MVSNHGWEKVDALLRRTGTVKELQTALVNEFEFTKKEAAKATSGELMDEVVPFALIFGPKLGSFFNNLSGNFDTTTMDRWFMRTFGRALGMQLDRVDKADVDAATTRLQSAMDAVRATPEGLAVFRAAGVRSNGPASLNNIAALASYFEKEKNREGLSADVDELRKAANAAYKIADGFVLIEAPLSGGHRRFIRLAMEHARVKF